MEKREDAALSLAGFLLLSALGFFAWQSDPLESARPINEPTKSTTSEKHARLWHDPLHGAHRDSDGKAPDGDGSEDPRGDCGRPPRCACPVAPQKAQPSALQEMAEELSRAGEQVRVLAVMVDGGPYAELEEARRRRRYAVLSALGEGGYEPLSPETLDALPFCDNPPKTVPYEWLEGDDGMVLVLWLDEELFASEPFAMFHRLVRWVVPGPGGQVSDSERDTRPDWVVLGPASSDTLELLSQDVGKPCFTVALEELVRRFRILSPLATAPNDILQEKGERTCDGDSILGPTFTSSCPGQARDPCFQFVRTLHTDDLLIRELVDELMLRGVEPTDAIAVVSEWDTAYGRGQAAILKRELEREVVEMGEEASSVRLFHFTYQRGVDGLTPGDQAGSSSRSAKGGSEGQGQSYDGGDVRRPVGTGQFDYLRRLSGELRREDRRIRVENGRGIRAVAVLGSDVYDKLLVLRALRNKLSAAVWVTTDLDANFIHPDEWRWTRNLVVVSSYDLRPPSTPPCTPRSSWVSPPFRDSYQTSAFVATRLALNDRMMDHFLREDRPKPGIYEVGRHGFVRLAVPAASRASPASAEEQLERPLAVMIGVGLLFALALVSIHQLLPGAEDGLRVATLLGLILLGGVAVVIFTGDITEPLSLWQGVSIWPTEALRLIAFGLALVWSYGVVTGLGHNWSRLNGCYLRREAADASASEPRRSSSRLGRLVELAGPIAVVMAVTAGLFFGAYVLIAALAARERTLFLGGLLFITVMAAVAWAGLWHGPGREVVRAEPGEDRTWMLGSVALVAAMFVVMVISQRAPWPQVDRLLFLGITWAVILTLWLLLIHGRLGGGVRVRTPNAWMKRPGAESLVKVWDTYRDLGRCRHRVLRALTYTVIYFAIVSVLFTLLPAGVPPCRGSSCVLDRVVLGASVIAMLVLLFLVVDAARLSMFWIEKLRKAEEDLDDTTKQFWADRLGVDTTHVGHWLKVQLIGERTNAVERLVYFPVLIYLIMLVARSPFFDNWVFPQALSVVVALNLAIAFGSVIALNSRARQARNDIVERLEEEAGELTADAAARARETAEQAGAPPPTRVSRAEIKHLIDDLKKFQLGAYQQVWNQPWIRGAVMILGGAAIAYTEQLSRF